jgi:hypothetical protein
VENISRNPLKYKSSNSCKARLKREDIEEMVPAHYCKFSNVFSKVKSKLITRRLRLGPQHNNQEGKELLEPQKAFLMSQKELKILSQFIVQELKLGRI